MKNRHLFRGKRAGASVKDSDWVVGYYTGASNGIHYIKTNTTEYCAVHGDTFGQCTGLIAAKSYRGENVADRLIFEGDVISCVVGLNKKQGYVYWNPGQGRWEANTGNSDETWRSDFLFTDGNNWCGQLDHMKAQLAGGLYAHPSVEIIGNIHDGTEETTC